jgi:hypothetical protein
MKQHACVLFACLAVVVSCDSGTTDPGDDCDTVGLPLSGSAAAPTVVSVLLEVQPSGIVLLATATDPQGTDNLLGVDQQISVFPNVRCTGTPIVVRDDLAGSGVEESFGTVVGATANPALYNAIASADAWPVDVDFRDHDGNRTAGRVMAAVVD